MKPAAFVRRLHTDEVAGWQALIQGLAPDLPRQDVRDLKAGVKELAGLRRQRDRWLRKAHGHTRQKRYTKPGSRVCGFAMCSRRLPHMRDDWTWHFRMIRLLKAQRKSPANKPGYRGQIKAVQASLRRRTLERRAAVFNEEAPRAAALLGKEGVYRIVQRVDWSQNYRWFRSWIQLHYAGRRPIRPDSMRNIDQRKFRNQARQLAPPPTE